jgi:glycosyltransferase involved in cell wall biosynthesis
MSERPLVTLTLTAYDRLVPLRECLDSFWATNTYPNVELVIVDNASTDPELIEFLEGYKPPCEYRHHRRFENDYPYGQKQARIKSREMAKGEYFIDCPDDHLFIIKDDWIERSIEHMQKDTLTGCIVHYAQPLYRWGKTNNEWEIHPDDPRFIRSLHKGYADYHIMSRVTYERLGPFKWALGRESEGEYMERALNAGYRRVLPRLPVAIINDLEDPWCLKEPLDAAGGMWDGIMEANRPIANEELIQWAVENSAVERVRERSEVEAHKVSDPALDEWLKG